MKIRVHSRKAGMSRSFAAMNKMRNVMRARGHGVSVHLDATATTKLATRGPVTARSLDSPANRDTDNLGFAPPRPMDVPPSGAPLLPPSRIGRDITQPNSNNAAASAQFPAPAQPVRLSAVTAGYLGYGNTSGTLMPRDNEGRTMWVPD